MKISNYSDLVDYLVDSGYGYSYNDGVKNQIGGVDWLGILQTGETEWEVFVFKGAGDFVLMKRMVGLFEDVENVSVDPDPQDPFKAQTLVA